MNGRAESALDAKLEEKKKINVPDEKGRWSFLRFQSHVFSCPATLRIRIRIFFIKREKKHGKAGYRLERYLGQLLDIMSFLFGNGPNIVPTMCPFISPCGNDPGLPPDSNGTILCFLLQLNLMAGQE